jgi:hypothetical protein
MCIITWDISSFRLAWRSGLDSTKITALSDDGRCRLGSRERVYRIGLWAMLFHRSSLEAHIMRHSIALHSRLYIYCIL